MEIQIEQETATFTVEQIFEAIKENGLEHLRGQWIATNGQGKVVGGCVLQQGAFNLGVYAANEDGDWEIEQDNTLYGQLNRLDVAPSLRPLGKDDTEHEKAGDAIITWNDAYVYDDNGKIVYDNGYPTYELETYADVVEKTRQILEPHFTKTVTLPLYRY